MNAQQYQVIAPRTKEMQETMNHLVLGITMWISVTVSCVTTLLTVNQPWCLLALVIPFTYTMFPQIQKAYKARAEMAYNNLKNKRAEPEMVELELNDQSLPVQVVEN